MFRIILEQVNPINGTGKVVSILEVAPFNDEKSVRPPMNMVCTTDRLTVGPEENFKFPRDSAKAWRFIARFINDVFKDNP